MSVSLHSGRTPPTVGSAAGDPILWLDDPRACDLQLAGAKAANLARAAAKEICKQRYTQFGCAGQGSKLHPMNLERMAQRYAKGELAAVVN